MNILEVCSPHRTIYSKLCLMMAVCCPMIGMGCARPALPLDASSKAMHSSAENFVSGDLPETVTSTNIPSRASSMTEKLQLPEDEWKRKLSTEQYYVLRQKGTERPFVNEFDEHFEPGTYCCAACGTELFDSDTKFNSGCGWPAFYAAKAGDKVNLHTDRSHGMVRTEVTCAHCDSHLGHIFDDAPQTPTGQRYCINSVSLKFTPRK